MINSLFSLKKLDIAICLVLATSTGLIFLNYNYEVKKNIAKDIFVSENFVYSPLTMKVQPARDEVIYAGMSRMRLEGKVNMDNIFEYEDTINPFPKLPFQISATTSKLLGSVASFFVFSDFIFPFISVALCYLFLLIFLENRLIAVWGGIIIISGINSMTLLFNIFLFRFESAFPYINSAVMPLKYPSYQLILPFTFLFYFCCYQLLKKDSRFYCLATGILAGLSFYMNVFSYVTIGLQIAFLMLCVFITGKKSLSLKFLITGLVALIIGSVYIKDIISLLNMPGALQDTIAMLPTKSVDYDMDKSIIKMILVILLISYLSFKIGSLRNNVVFLLSIGVPTIFMMVLGRFIFLLPEPQHYNTFEGRNVIYIGILLIIAICLNKTNLMTLIPVQLFNYFNKKYKTILFVRICIMSTIILHTSQIIISVVYSLNKNATTFYHNYTIDRDIMEAYTWLDKYALKESVVLSLSPQNIHGMLPMLTGKYLYIPNMFFSMCPLQESWDRIKQAFAFYGVDKRVLKDTLKVSKIATPKPFREVKLENESDLINYQQTYLTQYRKYWPAFVFHSIFRFDTNSLTFQIFNKYLTKEEVQLIRNNEEGKRIIQGLWFIPFNLINEQLNDYQSKTGNVDLLKYKVDYVWFGPMEKDLTGLNHIESDALTVAFQNEDVTLYKIDR